MLVRFFDTGGGSGQDAVKYLTQKCNHDRTIRDPAPEIMRGNPELTLGIIESSSFEKNYTSGALSFEEKEVDKSKLDAIIDSFEKDALFPGMKPEQYNVLWVLHRDKGRIELHFIIPNKELTTGKRLLVYYHGVDCKRIDQWKQIQNYKYELSSPDDLAKKRTISISNKLSSDRKESLEIIDRFISQKMREGTINNREDVIRCLQEKDFEITRKGQDYITIRDKEGTRMRLKGAYYGASFRSIEAVTGRQHDIRKDLSNATERDFKKIGSQFECTVERRRTELDRRYHSGTTKIRQRNQTEIGRDQNKSLKPSPEREITLDRKMAYSANYNFDHHSSLHQHDVGDQQRGRLVHRAQDCQSARIEFENTDHGKALRKRLTYQGEREAWKMDQSSSRTYPTTGSGGMVGEDLRKRVIEFKEISYDRGGENLTSIAERVRGFISNEVQRAREAYQSFGRRCGEVFERLRETFRHSDVKLQRGHEQLQDCSRNINQGIKEIDRKVVEHEREIDRGFSMSR